MHRLKQRLRAVCTPGQLNQGTQERAGGAGSFHQSLAHKLGAAARSLIAMGLHQQVQSFADLLAR